MTTARVRVSGPPNSNFLVGYPGISATLPRIEGKVEIRPALGHSAPFHISYVSIGLYRRETVHPHADTKIVNHLAAPRKEWADLVGKELMLYRCHPGVSHEEILYMDLPFVLFIPFNRPGYDAVRLPPATISLPSRTLETFYELVVSLHQGNQNNSEMKRFAFPVPLCRYDSLSTFGMYNVQEVQEKTTDHLVNLGIKLPRWSYGPGDTVQINIYVSPNPDWSKAKRVSIRNISVVIEEAITFNPEGDEPKTVINKIQRQTLNVQRKLPAEGFQTHCALLFPRKEARDNDGCLPRQKQGFPLYHVSGFTTTAYLYKIEYFLTVKATFSAARDITLRQRIVVCPLDHESCKEEMDAIEQAANDAKYVNPDNPMLPSPVIIRPKDRNALHKLGMTYVGTDRKLLIE
ncbi:hypothetical protein TWF506_011322 [Arthrobotrys conoides]|uniref:Arrestin C-terminal-like domain-containing protein n=1 Tax=Arthrobotrys conoides TaxID=74498 RepID=A0AAN8NJM1_9PEZI